MPRTRNIKPGFFRNEKLCDLPLGPRMLFAGLWTVADRAGRLRDSPKSIRADVFPFDDFSISKIHGWLQDLHDAEFIVRYEVGGEKYISIPTWGKHQNPHVKEPPSTIPAPDKPGARTVLEQDSSGAKPVQEPDESGKIPGSTGSARVLTTNLSPPSTNHSPLTTEVPPQAGAISIALAEWQRDKSYEPFVEAYKESGFVWIDDDFFQGHFSWKKLDPDQKRQRMEALRARIGNCDPAFLPKPRRFIDAEWQRKVKQAGSKEAPPRKIIPPPPLPPEPTPEQIAADKEYWAQAEKQMGIIREK